jgi:hypothetical protein
MTYKRLCFPISSLSQYKSKNDKMGRAYCTSGEEEDADRILVGKPERTRPLGRPRYKWEGNIKMCL